MLLRTFDLTHPYTRGELAWAALFTFVHFAAAVLCIVGAVVLGGWSASHGSITIAVLACGTVAVLLVGTGAYLLSRHGVPLAPYLRPGMPLTFRNAGTTSALSILDACFEHDEVEAYRRAVVAQRRPLTELEATLILMCFADFGPAPREPDVAWLEAALFGK